jgi:hypothetical protein
VSLNHRRNSHFANQLAEALYSYLPLVEFIDFDQKAYNF